MAFGEACTTLVLLVDAAAFFEGEEEWVERGLPLLLFSRGTFWLVGDFSGSMLVEAVEAVGLGIL